MVGGSAWPCSKLPGTLSSGLEDGGSVRIANLPKSVPQNIIDDHDLLSIYLSYKETYIYKHIYIQTYNIYIFASIYIYMTCFKVTMYVNMTLNF